MIKQGRGSELWLNEPNKKAHKDIEARWAKKNNETHFGYKVHAAVDEETKLMVHTHVTAANVHDSQVISPLLSDEEDAGKRLFADSACGGRQQLEEIESFGMIPEVCEKGTRGKPLTESRRNQTGSSRRRGAELSTCSATSRSCSAARSSAPWASSAPRPASGPPPWPAASFARPVSSARPHDGTGRGLRDGSESPSEELINRSPCQLSCCAGHL